VELARHHARVLVSDRDVASAQETAQRVAQAGGTASVLACDVTKLEEVEALAERAFSEFGGVDLLVNNAGVACGGTVGDMPLAEWRRVLDVNLWGVIHGCHVFVPRLKQQRSGHILNIASAAGLVSLAFMAPYNVSKAGVVSLSETLYAELKSQGIGVTVACPTFFRTNIAAAGGYSDPRLRELSRKLVDQATIEPEAVARECLRAVQRGAPYSLPIAMGRWVWRLKRLSPEAFLFATLKLQKRIMGPRDTSQEG
jgi:NAD(P)-dependent dehydrogenase (short-subunit alcohol dehydrogenase family)